MGDGLFGKNEHRFSSGQKILYLVKIVIMFYKFVNIKIDRSLLRKTFYNIYTSYNHMYNINIHLK